MTTEGISATRIVTLRHGPTAFAEQRKIAGTLDVPLSASGAEASLRVRPRLAALGCDVVVSSPLVRALDTARLATGADVEEIRVHAACMERDYGRMQGLSPDDVQALDPPVTYVRVGAYSHSLDPPGGESFPELRARAREFLGELLHAHSRKAVLVFSHQTFLQQFHGELLGMDEHECLALDIHHLEMNVFELDADRQLLAYHMERLLPDGDGSW